MHPLTIEAECIMLAARHQFRETDMTTDMATGRYLARLRSEAGLKQKDVAERVTWSPAVLSRVESGERPLNSEELDSVLGAIGTKDAMDFRKVVARVWKQLPKPPLGHPDESLLWKTEQALREVEEVLLNPSIKNSFASLLKELKKGLTVASRTVQSTEHSVALVGDIGVGKSTAICRAADLEVVDKKTATPAPVLEVGGGGVTVCEVHLAQGPEYGLLIEPMGEQELRREVLEFATLLKDPPQTTPSDDDTGGQVVGTSKELERAIRNMSRLTKTRRRQKGPDGKRVRITIDPAEKLARASMNTSTFVLEILARMNLEGRTKRELWYSATENNGDPLEWLKRNFELLNNGRHPDFSIPQRMELIVPRPILGEKSLSIRLIDTKGVDRTAERADIGRLFSEPNTIVVMCSTFNSTPSTSVQQLLKRVKDGRFEGIENKAVVLALPRHDEALAVKDDDGFAAESVEDGYDLKREHAESTIQSIGLPDLRVEFFNALRDDSEAFRSLLVDIVEDLRHQHCLQLEEMIVDAHSLVRNFEQEQTMEVQRDAARRLQVWLDNNHELNFGALYAPERSLMRALNSAHPSSVRASVRREGEWYNLEYSHQLSYGARVAAARVVERKLERLFPIIENLLQDEQLEDAFGLLRQARRVVEVQVESLFRKCQIEGKGIHVRDMKPSTVLWDDCDDEWGRGPGYRDRVVGHHDVWFGDSRRDYRERIKGLVEREWKETLRRLSAIIEIE